MFQYGTFPNVKTYSRLIKSAAKANDPYKCLEFLEKIISRGEKTNSATLNFLLEACLSSEDVNIQENTNIIIELMSHWKIGPNGTTFIILLQHCKNYEQLEDIWNKTLKYRLCNNKRLQEEIIKICCTKLSFNKSLIYENQHNMENGISKCFDYFLRFYRISKGEIPLGIYNTLLKYCIMNGDIFRSMRILEMMWEKNLEPKKSLYKNLFNSIHDNTVNNRTYTWRLIEGIFSRPKTIKLQKSLLNSMILTLGRLRDVRGIMEFYQSKIGFLENNHNSSNNMNRTNNIPMDIKLYNIFMKAVSECKYGPLNCMEIIKYTPIGLQLNHISVKYLFSSLRTKKDIKLFGSTLFEIVIKQEIIISKDVLEDIIRNTVRNVSNKVGYGDIIIKHLVNEIINVQEGKDLLNCLNILEMPC
jgi:pentatricopeptide repeat protein